MAQRPEDRLKRAVEAVVKRREAVAKIAADAAAQRELERAQAAQQPRRVERIR